MADEKEIDVIEAAEATTETAPEESLPLAMSRRRAVGLLGVLGSAGLVACGGGGGGSNSDSTSTSTDDSSSDDSSSDDSSSDDSSDDDSSDDSSSDDDSSDDSSSDDTSSGSCVIIPTETQGPYPLLAVLSNSAMVRADITEGKTGVPLTVKLKLVDVNNGCEAITSSASVYIWHCDKDGVYSGYSQPGVNTVGETFLRGIQDVDEDGYVTFTTIYPGWYSGRITHIHFQVYLYSASTATATSQIAFPQDITEVVYDSSLYAEHGQNTSVTSFSRDNVFSDGTEYQMATVEGSVSEGYVATLEVGIAYS